MQDIFRTLIVPEASVTLARWIAASFGSGGEGMWTTGLSADGAEPATHYVSTGYVPGQHAYLVPCQTWEWQIAPDGTGAWVKTGDTPGDPAALYQLAQSAGIVCTEADIASLFASSDETEQEPFVAFGRLGLQLVQTPLDIGENTEGHA